MPKAGRKDLRGGWERGNKRVMAAGKEEEANNSQDENEKEEEEKQVQKFLTALGEQQWKKGRFENLS